MLNRSLRSFVLVLTVPMACAQAPRVGTTIGKDGSEMVLIPGGPFHMGTDQSSLPSIVEWIKKLYPEQLKGITVQAFEDEVPRHPVRLASFYIDRYEVTNAQYRTFVRATGHREPEGMAIIKADAGFGMNAAFRPWSDSNFNSDRQPVVAVSRDDARAYCNWAGKRLPSEAEWEKAARGGLAGKQFTWGDEWPPPDRAGNFAEEAFKRVFTENRFPAFAGYDDGKTFPALVGSFNANGYGLFDMAGNVSEWVEDNYAGNYYRHSATENPLGPPTGESAISRGGSWFYKWAYVIRVAKREDGPPNWRAFDQGFRCVMSK